MSLKAHSEHRGESEKGRERALLIKFLIGLCAILAAAIIVAVISIVVISLKKQTEGEIKMEITTPGLKPSFTKENALNVKSNGGVCDTPQCKMTAKNIEEMLNRNVKPCDDFYEFACGGWVKNTIIQPTLSVEYNFQRLNEVLNQTREVLEEPANPNNLEALEKAKAFYRSCMDLDSIDKLGLIPLREVFQENDLAFPLLGMSKEDIPFEKTLVSYMRAGLSSFISLSATKDLRQSKGKILKIKMEDLTVYYGKSEYTNPKRIKLLRTYFLNLTTAISGKTPSEVNATVNDMVDYEIGASKLWYNLGEKPLEKDTHKLMTLKELNKTFTGGFDITWTIIEAVKTSGIRITEDDVVYISDYQAMLRLGKYIAGISDKGLLKNLLGLDAVRTLISFLPKELRQIKDAYDLEYRQTKPKPRWETCVSARLDYATTRIFAEKYFPLKKKQATERLVAIVKAATHMMLALNDWMDLTTSYGAIAKVNKMDSEVAYPAWIFNDVELNRFYSNTTVVESESLKSDISAKRNMFINTMLEYNIPDIKIWLLSPLMVNGYYSPSTNAFYLFAGIIQPPFYHVNYPMAMNFGGLGNVVGHEISHGFDSTGRHRDKNGDFINWWTNKSSENYEKRVSCLVDQYSGYLNEQINKTLRGNQTKKQDIADVVGLHTSFKAYRSWVENRGREEDRLAGLEFTPNQLFFIGHAQRWCAKGRTATLLRNHDVQAQSYWKFRVNGPVDSYKGFVETFNCPLGSPMNPGRKCKLW